MNKLTRALALGVGVAALVVGGVLAPTAAQAKKPPGYEKCGDGTFHVLSKGDSITDDDGTTKNVKQGYYKTYVYSDGAISCYDASRLFHNFLAWGATYEKNPPSMPAWFISKGKYAMDEGGEKKWSWKKAVNFSYGSDESGFEGGFIMKKVKNPS
jgi:hypothetical protein